MIDTPYQFKSLASRVRGMHGALDADELAKLLGVAKVTILRRAKRGTIPSFRIGTVNGTGILLLTRIVGISGGESQSFLNLRARGEIPRAYSATRRGYSTAHQREEWIRAIHGAAQDDPQAHAS